MQPTGNTSSKAYARPHYQSDYWTPQTSFKIVVRSLRLCWPTAQCIGILAVADVLQRC